MRTRKETYFTTIRTEGGLFPSDLLNKISASDGSIDGVSLESYHLDPNERINEATSRSWNRITQAWQSFSVQRKELPDNDTGTSPTRERWLLVLFQELGYGRLTTSKAVELKNKVYPISHFWKNSPIHLVGVNVDIDKRTPGVAGAARNSPHSLVQDFLNNSEAHLWGFVSNGLRLRILRDNVSLTRQAYVEFDLEAMMEGQVYSDFVMLWLLCHESRVEAEKPEECWLERWVQTAREQGTRALDSLRNGVEEAIKAFGSGFISNPANGPLKDKLRSGELSLQDYYRQLLRLAYRLIFLFVAEDRNLLFPSNAKKETVDFYLNNYSVSRLRRISEKIRGTKHTDLYHSLRIVMQKLGENGGCEHLGLSVLGSFLWSSSAIPDIFNSEISNSALLSAIRSLAFIVDGKILRAIDYKNLGSEELGSVYESLLELHPEINIDAGIFDLKTVSGHERKTTGSYYTPSSLINCLLDSALEPVINEASKKDNPEKALLDLKICDPACGSGHFLIAAAHRLSKRIAAIRTGDDEPSPEAVKTALRDVIGHCVYGVDINPMAVELCKVALWMEALEPGKPLSFLDHRIQCGNSLLGTTPRLLNDGIPDGAFEAIEGDDKAICKTYKKRNKAEREGRQRSLFDHAQMPWDKLGNLATAMVNLDDIEDSTIEGIRNKQQRYEDYVKSSGYLFGRFLADAWCSAFVWKKIESEELPYPITEELFRNIEKNPHTAPPWVRKEVKRLAEQYQFFHWHIMFSDVFRIPRDGEEPENNHAGWSGGFDVVLGNPPWEKIKLQEKEWFADRRPDIALAPNATARRRLIANLKVSDSTLYDTFIEDKRKTEGESHFIRQSLKYPLCGSGDINTYTIFAEFKRHIINTNGRVGCIVPTGIATDDTTKYFFQDIINSKSLVSLYDFENTRGIFGGVHRSYKFSLLTLCGSQCQHATADIMFFAIKVEDLKDINRHFSLTSKDIELINPNTKTCPIFRSKKDAELIKNIYNKVPILLSEATDFQNLWGIKYFRMFDMSNDSNLFISGEELEKNGCALCGNNYKNNINLYLPLYEGKMVWLYNHRYASVGYHGNVTPGRHDVEPLTLKDLLNPHSCAVPRFWIDSTNIPEQLANHLYFIAYRRITNNRSERTAIHTIIPPSGAGDTCPIITLEKQAEYVCCFLSNANSFILDYVSRFKVGGIHLDFFVAKQLTCFEPDYYNKGLPWDQKSIKDWICPRVIELVYTSYDISEFAEQCRYNNEPFVWDETRRFMIQCELDAAYFHFYGIHGNDVSHIMDSFTLIKNSEENEYGEYKTKRVILEIYDEMAEAMRTGKPYMTRLDPPPADPRCTHKPNKSEA